MKKTLIILLTVILTLSLFISCEGDIDSALAAKITVTFDGNGSTGGEMAALKVKKGEDFKLTKNAFEKTGYIFTGWNTAADGSGTAYANEGTAKFDKDTTLYAQWIEELTITFNANGGTPATKTQKVVKGIATALDANSFEKTDYIFTGWNTAADGSGTAYANEGTAKFDKDTTLYAQWIEELTITFNANDGTPATKTQKVGKGIATALDANTFTRTSYYFAGWSSSAGGAVEYADKANITLTGDKILYAVWSDNPVVTLTNGTGISEVTGSGSYAPGAEVTINATVADGYTWSKWTQTTGGADVSTTKAYSFTMGTENINYTANATANTYNVTLVTNGGTIATGKDVTSYTYGVGATLPTASDITKSGHSFGGWYANSECTGDAVTSISTTDTGDKTFYAQWIEELTITFNANDGSETPETKTQKVVKGIATALDANTFTRTSYYFAGWSSSAGGAVEYADKADITLSVDKVLYAVWSVNPVVTLTTGTGISYVTGSGSYEPGAVVTINATVVDGYTWSKWTQTTGGADVSTTKAYSFTMGTENINYTANATANTYNVTLVTNGGTIATGKDVTSYTYGVGATLPTASDITKSGHSFGGWYANSECTGDAVTSISTTDTGDKTFYAQWIEEVTITFKANGGTGDDKTQKVEKDVETALDANSFTSPQADKIFAGWTTDAAGEKTYYGDKESVTLTENITLYAQWGIDLNNLADKYAWENGKTYTITNDLTLADSRITVSGTSKLFLASGKTLTVSKGIKVTSGNSLTINGDGSLIAGGTATPTNAAGIGGDSCDGGTVTINGGTVTATGGQYGAGIGGASGGAGGTVTINDGKVTANGGLQAAGIGGGPSGAGGIVTINGGTVTANGGQDAHGIGRGYGGGSDGTLKIGNGVNVYEAGSGSPYASGPQDNVTDRYQNMKVNNFN